MGNKLSTFILTKNELIKTITDSSEFIIQYIYPLHYKGFFKGYKTVSKKFVQSTASLNDDMYEPVKSKMSHHRTSKRHTSKGIYRLNISRQETDPLKILYLWIKNTHYSKLHTITHNFLQ